MDGTFMLHFMVTFLISLVLFRVKASLIMIPFGYLADSVVARITLTFLGSGSVEIVPRRVVGQWECGGAKPRFQIANELKGLCGHTLGLP